MTKEKIIKTIVSEFKTKYRYNNKKKKEELSKLLRFVKSSSYFEGKRRSLYKIIINERKNG